MNLLGHVAKGVSGAVFGKGDHAGGYSPEDEEVEALLSRISDGVLAEDRREAIFALRDLLLDNQQVQMAVGAMGFPVLMEVLKEDREDTNLVQGALEVLINACGFVAGQSSGDNPNEVQAGALNSDLFAREPSNTHLLLSLLEDEPVGINDFYVRYHTVQLLTALLSSSAYRLQEAILARPMGVVRLMDMMMEREVIRNEALLLLVALTRGNKEVQKIAAFEGGFEQLLNIIREEGALDGGIVVLDCLELLNNLLRGNSSNQLMFREMGFLQHLLSMLKIGPSGDSVLPDEVGEMLDLGALPQQKAANMLCALETVRLLITSQAPPGNTPKPFPAAELSQAQDQNLVANKEMLLSADIMGILLNICLHEGGVSSCAVRVQALECISSLVEGDQRRQERLGGAAVHSAKHPLPALQAVLRVALYAEEAAERSAARDVLRCYCSGNPDGQSLLASTIAPAGVTAPDGGGGSFGGDLVKALARGAPQKGLDLQGTCRAAAVLSYLLDTNQACKEKVLRIPLLVPESEASPPELLLPRVVRGITAALQQGGEEGRSTASVLLRLLITWLTDCQSAVAAFLQPAAHVPTLIDIITGKLGGADGCVAGLACVLAGVCLVHSPANTPGNGHQCSTSMLLDVLSNRVGLATYFSRWEELRKHPGFVAAASGPKGPQHFTRASAAAATAADAKLDRDSEGTDDPFDHAFTQFVAEFQEKAQQFVLASYARPHQAAEPNGSRERSWSGSESEQLTQAKQALHEAEMEMQELRARNVSLAETLFNSSSRGSTEPTLAADSSQGTFPGPAYSGGTAEALAAAEMRAVKAEAEARGAKEQLTDLRKSLTQAQGELDREWREHEEQKSSANKLESDLSDLSAAYNTLENHSYSLESENKELKLKLKAMDGVAAKAGGISEEEAQSRVDEAVAEAQAEGEESMTDLLECLGQEEAKVERLREKLEEMGEDVDMLLQGVGEDGDGDKGEGDGDSDGGENEGYGNGSGADDADEVDMT